MTTADGSPTSDRAMQQSAVRLAWPELTVAIAATLLAIGLQAFFISNAQALWRDEVGSLATSSAPWPDLWRLMEFESFPPLWNVLLRGWVTFGGGASDLTLRLAGLIGAFGLVAAVWFALWKLGRAVPLVSLALLAVNPEVIRWGTTLRPWSLGAALALLMVVAVRELRDARGYKLVLSLVVVVAAVQALYQNAILLAVTIGCAAILLALARDWKPAVKLLAAGAVALVSLLPYTGIIARRADWNGLSENPVTMAELAGKFWEFMMASGPIVAGIWCALPLAGIALLVTSTADRALRTYVLAVAGASIAAIFLFYLQFGYPTQTWYYLPLASLLAVLTEVAIAREPGPLTRRIRVAAAIVVLVAGTTPAVSALRTPQSTMNEAAAVVAANATSGDVVIVSPWYLATSFKHYYRGAADVMTVPPMYDVHVHRYDLLKKAMMTRDVMKPLLGRLEHVLSAGNRVFLVGGLAAPEPGSSARELDPPPHPETGWNSVPYEQAWILQLGEFLRAHTSGGVIPLRHHPDSPESPQVMVMAGWK